MTEQEYTTALSERKRLRRDWNRISMSKHSCEENLRDLSAEMDLMMKHLRKVEFTIAEWEGRITRVASKGEQPFNRRKYETPKVTAEQMLQSISTEDLIKLLQSRGMTGVAQAGEAD